LTVNGLGIEILKEQPPSVGWRVGLVEKLALRRFPPTLVKHWEKLKKPMQTPRQGT